jgi:outer membrane protein assembly factor BamB
MKRVIVIAVVLLLVSSAFGAELLVPSQYPTIQSAVSASVTGDTIIISPSTYTGAGNYNIIVENRNITIRSVDPNDWGIVESTVIDCNGLGYAFGIESNSIIDGFTITDGNGSGISTWGIGSPLIRNCDIRDNNSSPTGSGGGISANSNTTIIGCKISGNYSRYGGGILCSSSGKTVTISDCSITGNTSSYSGGGIYTSASLVTITRSLIAGNVASGTTSASGGGIYGLTGRVDINNSILAGNFAQGSGGGIYKYSITASVTMSNCTLAGNSASNLGGGVYSSTGNFSALHSIFWDNNDSTGITTSAQISPLPSTPGQMLLFCCIADLQNKFGDANNGNINDDPMFVRDPNDGGDGWGVGGNDDYGDLHLRPDSPCIDAGNPIYRPGPNDTDIDGEQRLIGHAVDIGAYEYSKIIIVTKPAGGEVWATGSKHPIKWDKYGVGSVDIRFSSDNGNTWETIASAIADVNSYIWQLPGDIESNQCVISVVPSVVDANVISESSGLFTVSWYPTRPAVPSQWLRRGLLPSPNLNENKGPRIGCIKWVFETDGPVSSQVAVSRPYWDSYFIYIGSEDGNIYALDDLGELNWICDINTAVVGSPAVGYYWMVYAAGQNGRLYAIDDYGDIAWTHKTDGPIYSTPVVGYDGKIYVCSEDGLIYALDADGSELWTFKTSASAKLNGAIFATPAIDKNGTVYIGGLYEPNLYALDANSGSIKWVCNFGAVEPNKGQIVASPAIGPNGTIYQTLVRDPNLYAVDPCTGNILWSTQLRPDPCYACAPGSGSCCATIDSYLTKLHNHATISPALLLQYESCNEGRWQGIPATGWINYTTSSGWSSPVVGSDGTIYVSFDDPYLRAVEPNGTIKWITRLGVIGGFTLSIDKDNHVYAASDDNFVCVVDPNGLEVSRFQGKGWVSFPAIAEDGTIIVSDANNRVWAITSNSCDGQSPVLHRPADMRANNMIDFSDFAILGESWRYCTDPFDATFCASGISKYGLYAPGDVDRDAYINLWDLNALADEWMTQSNFE